ncbi:D-alanyl-D-alanine carboxypeptidase [Candidatus Saccharibacteria bacterium]|nr:D-alanyl-D-alanine carboxypeptidase [Candidatus Saccharibacteria bacterium]
MRLGGDRKIYIQLVGLLLLTGLVLFVGWRLATYNYSLQPQLVLAQERTQTEDVRLDWPSYGQSAIAIEGLGAVETFGEEEVHPTASMAKVITMMAVLEKKPLKLGEAGSIITLTQADVASYNDYIARNGSNTPVYAGLELTQYQAIQSVLLPSSNNMADTLAVWAFGSIDNYHQYANIMVDNLGASQTTIAGDASGLSPKTTSTASDMAKIALKALENPVLAEIVAQPAADVPYAGTIRNSNRLLSNPEIIGVKTGETVEAGGNFMLGADFTIGQKSRKVAVVVMGADVSPTAQADSLRLYNSTKPYIRYQEIVKKDELVANYQTPWGEIVAARATGSIWDWTWRNQHQNLDIDLDFIAKETETTRVGEVKLGESSTLVELDKLPNPPILWKVLPFVF